MRTVQSVVLLIAMALPLAAQQPAPVKKDSAPAPSKAAGSVAANPARMNAEKQRLESALKFVQASDARPRLEQSLDKLLEEGKQAMMQRNPGLDPQFGDAWVKRMKQRVKPDDFVEITAKVYATYYTSDELEQMTQAQLALKNSKIYSVAPELNQKIKANAPHIQQDINTDISRLGSTISIEVGQEIEKEHPEWAKPLPPGSSTATPAPPAKK
jgi:hypothetical protein